MGIGSDNRVISARDRYLFDVRGYVVIPEVLDPEKVQRLSGLLDDCADAPTATEPRRQLWGFLHRDQAFRDLLDHPAVLPYLTEWVGDSFRLDHAYGFHFAKGAPKLDLHLGNTPYVPSTSYTFRDGRIFSGLTVVSYALADVGPDDGGFCCVPGSHKGNLPIPAEIAALDDLDGVVQPTMHAGDALIFTEALTHGTMPWTADHHRKALLYKYMPGHMVWGHIDDNDPALFDLLTPRQRQLFEPPYVYRETTGGYRKAVGQDHADALESVAG
jgi:hypothetical protein